MTTAEYITVASILAGFFSLAWQSRAKRNDDKRTAQLDRLNRQLSDLYGPLYALYEAGERNWMRFMVEYSHDYRSLAKRGFLPTAAREFAPPDADQITEYRRRMEELFMPTNLSMESVIAQHADLVVGSRMPEPFSDFLAHVAAARLLVQRWRTDATFKSDAWERHRIEYPHPNDLKHVIRGSFEVLKLTQQRVLTRHLEFVDEQKLEKQIAVRIEQLRAEWNAQGPSYATKLQATLPVSADAAKV